MQYDRLMIKAILDLKNNRGKTGENLSKIAYYGVVQNVIFTSLQPALFSALGDEFLAAAYSNAAIKTKIEIDVDERIVAGLLDEADRAEEIKKLLSKSNEDFYAPVTEGLNLTLIHM